MLPPPAGSRQNSYAYNLPHTLPRQISRHLSSLSIGSRIPSNPWHSVSRQPGPDLDAEDFEMPDDEEENGMNDEERGLEETLEKLGLGAYHWRLLALCGFGWMSDNSALQCIGGLIAIRSPQDFRYSRSVILPRVQVHWDLSARVVGLVSASAMAGMMIGAVGWGVVSDLLGRALPFNSTLFLTAVFGIAASFAPTFGTLCLCLFFLGTAVGGSMPTDGTLFLENLPHSKQYLLTLLSVFFGLGAVLSSTVSYVFLPGASCRHAEGCDVDGGANDGWRRVLFVLGLVNLACALMRWFLFRLHESPRYLVSNGREADAVVALRAIATFNDHDIDIQEADVQCNEAEQVASPTDKLEDPSSERPSPRLLPPSDRSRDQSADDSAGSGSRTKYDSVGMGAAPAPRSQPLRHGSAFYTNPDLNNGQANAFDEAFGAAQQEEQAGLMNGEIKGQSADVDAATEGSWLESWKTQMGKLFVPQWRRTVVLMWIIWGSMSFAYTMFNVWLPAVLESRATGEGDEAIKEALMEFVLYSLAGCPGSIIGAWMIQTSLGRRKSLAICTIATALSTFAFIRVDANWAVITSSMVIALAATAMYAVLYGMTPETFGTSIRGTACGTSAALSRLTGILAPVIAGGLLTVSPSLPVFTAAAIFVVTAACSLALPFERVAEGKSKGGALMH